MAVSFYQSPKEYAEKGLDQRQNPVPNGAIIFAFDNSTEGRIYVQMGTAGTTTSLVCFTPSDAAKLVGNLNDIDFGNAANKTTVVKAVNYVYQQLDLLKKNAMTAKDVKAAIDTALNELGTVYSYQGSVDTVDQLPTENVKNGHVYNVNASGMNYAAVVSTNSYKEAFWFYGTSGNAMCEPAAPGTRIKNGSGTERIYVTVVAGTKGSSQDIKSKSIIYATFDDDGNVVVAQDASFSATNHPSIKIQAGDPVYHIGPDKFVYYDCDLSQETYTPEPLVGMTAGVTVTWDALGVPFSLEWQ